MNVVYQSLYIGGEWVSPSSSRTINVFSASTEELIGSVPDAVEADVDVAVAAARRAFDDPQGWRSWHPIERAAGIERIADALDTRAGEMAQRVSAQNGMPISTARRVEGVLPPAVLRLYAQLIRDAVLEDIRPGSLGGRIKVTRSPIGVVASIVPWNFPQTLAAFKLGPALAMGCTLVLKPSPETVLDAQLFAEAVHEAGLPPGVINIVAGDRETGRYLVEHPQIDKVAFTGSTAAGRSIAEVCGRQLRPVTLELGGKSAAIVLDDADLDAHLDNLYDAVLLNSGQTCHLSTRILAPASRYGEIVDTITDFVKSLKVGDALDESTRIGPMASSRHRARVESYIAKGKSDGARLTTGGSRPPAMERGWFLEPTVFADVDNGTTIAQEEIFGPVLSVISYTDVDDAVRIANASDYGLGGSVWTADSQRGEAVAARIHTGSIGINYYGPDPLGPFGGVKASGLGRELGPEGLAAYQSLKSTYLPY
ncbi:aldehyde dehydrogenase (NAD+) [Mycobacterium sp. MAA66]|uniref:aldehyde dehydrogenase n=1 Tax=Mycobacterium sp. MAA66 TaxID=3156297 RepID=UPI003515A65F